MSGPPDASFEASGGGKGRNGNDETLLPFFTGERSPKGRMRAGCDRKSQPQGPHLRVLSALSSPASGRGGHPREPHEHYVEERWVSRRLFETVRFADIIVDPCAGFGNVVLSARAAGKRAFGSDLIKRARFVSGGRDFLSPSWRPPRGVDGPFDIVGNPPFGAREDLIRAFAEAALERADRVALMAPVERLAAAGKWLDAMPLTIALHISPRPSLWPGPEYAARIACGAKLGTGLKNCVWLIFDRGAKPGEARMGWLRRDG